MKMATLLMVHYHLAGGGLKNSWLETSEVYLVYYQTSTMKFLQ